MYSNKETDAEYEMMMQAALSSGNMSMPVMRKKTQAEMFMDTEMSKSGGVYGSHKDESGRSYKNYSRQPCQRNKP